MKTTLNFNIMKEANKDTKYQCPMHCEGDKVYDKPGNCPVCNMRLTPAGEGHHH